MYIYIYTCSSILFHAAWLRLQSRIQGAFFVADVQEKSAEAQ